MRHTGHVVRFGSPNGFLQVFSNSSDDVTLHEPPRRFLEINFDETTSHPASRLLAPPRIDGKKRVESFDHDYSMHRSDLHRIGTRILQCVIKRWRKN